MRSIQMSMARRGFTIVELLVVIVVIAILAAITVVSYRGVRDRAEATAIMSEIAKVEKGLKLKIVSESSSTWPIDTSFDGTNNSDLAALVRSGNALSNYISDPSSVASGTIWYYDNDAGSETTAATVCSNTDKNWDGVILAVIPLRASIITLLDSMIDKGDGLDCGRLRIGNAAGTEILYQLSWGQSLAS